MRNRAGHRLRINPADYYGPSRVCLSDPKSAPGPKAKYSLRAHIDRFAPESGLKSDIAGGPFRADIVAKVFFG
jgi:hypothetical protein